MVKMFGTKMPQVKFLISHIFGTSKASVTKFGGRLQFVDLFVLLKFGCYGFVVAIATAKKLQSKESQWLRMDKDV